MGEAAGTTVDDGLAVVWGGHTGIVQDPQVTNHGWIVDTTGKAAAIPTAPSPITARSNHVAIGHAGSVYIWGGHDEDGGVLNDGAVLDPSTNVWRQMTAAPMGLAAAHVAVHGDRLLFAAGRREANRPNSTLLEYDTVGDRWTSTTLDTAGVAAWTMLNDEIVTLSRGSNGADLTINRFQRNGRRLSPPTLLRTGLPIADYLAITDSGDGVLVAASDRDRTVLFHIGTPGTPATETTLDAALFTPGTRYDGFVGATLRQGDSWLGFLERELAVMSVETRGGVGTWRLDSCRTGSTWITLRAKTFLRYGGVACGGDLPAQPGGPLTVLSL